VIDYFAGILIENAPEERKKRWLIMSLAANIGVLAVFKYYNFFIGNVQEVFNWMGITVQLPLLRILLPIGLSFHTFQAMSYTFEVYYENQKAERNFGIYALYVMFYPQLVAGPIERPQNVLYQFYEKHVLKYENVADGLRMMLWGMIKKVVIADRLGLVTSRIFDDPASQSGINVVIGYVFFTFQVYCDFSGYSDIAIGAARVMGFNLMKNFNFPFRAKSVSDFYKRWHMSLSTWFNDYLHTPLTYSFRRMGLRGVALATVITFFISGLWHGSAWQFILWGVMMGVAIAFEVLTQKQRKAFFALFPARFGSLLAQFITFSYISFWCIFFRANTVGDAFMMMRKVGDIPGEIATILHTNKFGFLNLPNVYDYLLPGLAVVCFLEGCNWLTTRFDMPKTFSSRPSWLRWSVYYAGILLLMFCGVYEKHQFIYFQF
jgi:D-alanyl-lipoteichoic acid acyltransferase DltB (MBOAT superfamily)